MPPKNTPQWGVNFLLMWAVLDTITRAVITETRVLILAPWCCSDAETRVSILAPWCCSDPETRVSTLASCCCSDAETSPASGVLLFDDLSFNDF